MKVLGISCSPRRAGNTDLLLDELLRGASKGFCHIEKLTLANLNISACTQCDRCRPTGLCPIRDDMQLIYPKLVTADSIVLASPIYFMAHCAQAKLLIDRCQPFWVQTALLKQSLRHPRQPTRRGVFIAVGATRGAQVFAGAKVTMKWFFRFLQVQYWDNLLFDGIETAGAIRRHPTALREAFELGLKLAHAAK